MCQGKEKRKTSFECTMGLLHLSRGRKSVLNTRGTRPLPFGPKKKTFRVLCWLKMRLTTSSTKDEGRFWIIYKIKLMHSRTDDASRQEGFDKGANVVKYITDI